MQQRPASAESERAGNWRTKQPRWMYVVAVVLAIAVATWLCWPAILRFLLEGVAAGLGQR